MKKWIIIAVVLGAVIGIGIWAAREWKKRQARPKPTPKPRVPAGHPPLSTVQAS